MRALPISLLAVACSTAPPPPDGVPAALHDAHAAWIEGDLDALTAAVHDTLAVDPTPDVVHNAVSLLHTAFQEHPTLPTDQVLPPGCAACPWTMCTVSAPMATGTGSWCPPWSTPKTVSTTFG